MLCCDPVNGGLASELFPQQDQGAEMEARLPAAEICKIVHISARKKLLYVAVPKVACTSIKIALSRAERDNPDFNPEKPHNRKENLLQSVSCKGGYEAAIERINAPAFFRFTFVRNPFVRVLSAYLDKFAERQGPIRRARVNRRAKLGFDASTPVSFTMFVDALAQQRAADMDVHWRVQTEQTLFGDIRYDLVGRMESFSSDMARLAESTGVDLRALMPPPHNRTDAKCRLTDFYTPGIVDIVRRVYAPDFDAFGYTDTLPDQTV